MIAYWAQPANDVDNCYGWPEVSARPAPTPRLNQLLLTGGVRVPSSAHRIKRSTLPTPDHEPS